MTDTELAIQRIAEVKAAGFGAVVVKVQDGRIIYIEKTTGEQVNTKK
jgi:hypothetical protein